MARPLWRPSRWAISGSRWRRHRGEGRRACRRDLGADHARRLAALREYAAAPGLSAPGHGAHRPGALVAYLAAGRPVVLAWVAFAVILVNNGLGDTLTVRGHRERHGRSGALPDFGRAGAETPAAAARHVLLVGVTFLLGAARRARGGGLTPSFGRQAVAPKRTGASTARSARLRHAQNPATGGLLCTSG